MESSTGESSEAILYRNSGITSSISDYYKSEIDSRFNSSAVVSSSSDDSTAKSSTSNNLNSDAVSISGYDNSTAKSSITNSENCTSNYDSNAKISKSDSSSTTTSESSSENFVVKSSISDYQSTVIYDNQIGKTNTQVYNCSSKPCIRQNFESRSTSNVKFAENNRTNKRYNTPCCISDPPVYDRRDSFGEYLLMRKHKCKRCSCEDNKKYATFKTRLREREYFLDALNKTRRNQILKQMAKVKHPSEIPDEPPPAPADPNAPKVEAASGSESGSSGNATPATGEGTPASATQSAVSTNQSATSAPSANQSVTSAGPAGTSTADNPTGSKKRHAIENKMSVESVLIERQSLIDISKNRTKRFAKHIGHSKKSVEFDKSVEIELEKDTRSKMFKKFKRSKEKLNKMGIKSEDDGKKSKMKGKEDSLDESDAKILESFQSNSILFEDVDKKSKKHKKKKKKGKKDDDDDDDDDNDKDEDEEKDKDEEDDDEDDEGKSKKKHKKKKKKKSKHEDEDEDEDEDDSEGKKKKKKKKKDKDDDDDDGEEDEESDGSKKGKKKGKKSKKSKKKKKKDEDKEESDSSSSVDSDDESEAAQDKRDRKEVKRLEKLLKSDQFKLAFTADPNAGWFMSCMDYDQAKETDIQLLRRKGRCYCDFERNPDCICTGIPPGHEDVTPYDCKEGCCCDINPNPKCNCG